LGFFPFNIPQAMLDIRHSSCNDTQHGR